MLEVLNPGSYAVGSVSCASIAQSRLVSTYLSNAERRALDGVALPERTTKANSDLVHEGAASDQLFVLTEGWACRYKTTRDGSRQIVALLVPGDVANLDVLMFGRLDYGVRTLTKVKTIALPCDRVLALAERHAGVAKALTRLAMVENAILSQWALGLGRQSALQRLAHLFCELAVRLSGDEHASGFDLPLTQEQLGDVLGLTPVHVNRTMQQLRSMGLIATVNRTMTLPDVPRLWREGEFYPSYLHLATGTDRKIDA